VEETDLQFTPVQTGPGAHPASCTMGPGPLYSGEGIGVRERIRELLTSVLKILYIGISIPVFTH